MTAKLFRPIDALSPLADGARAAVESGGDWTVTTHLVAENLRRHLPAPDVLTAAQRRVRNPTTTTAISIHIYGTDVTRIGSSARRYYDEPWIDTA
jgi:hypothetical protein